MLRVVALVAVAFHLATGQTVDALDQPFEQMGLLQGRGRDQLKVEEKALENQTAETQNIIVEDQTVEDQTVENQTANNTKEVAGGWRSVKVSRKVCIRAKGGKPGRLTLPRHMRVSQVIFTYRKARGHRGLTCRGHGKAKHRSKWGCDGGRKSKLGLVITKRNKKVVMPRKSQKISGFSRTKHKHAHWYTMRGVNDKSPRMRWRLRKPFNTGKTSRYQVWYNENLSKGTVRDNAGRACYRVDVFGRAPAPRRCHVMQAQARKKCFVKMLRKRAKCVKKKNAQIVKWMKEGMKENKLVERVMRMQSCDTRAPTTKRAMWIAKSVGTRKNGWLKAVRMMKRAARRQKLQKCKRAPKNRKGQRALKALSAIKKVLGSLGQTNRRRRARKANRRRRARKANRRRRAKKVTMRQAKRAKRSKCKHHQNLKRKYQKSQTVRSNFIKKNCRGNVRKTCNICKKRKTKRSCKNKKNAQRAVCKMCKRTRKPCNICQRKKNTVRRINARVNRFHRHCKVLKGRFLLKTHHRKYVRAQGRATASRKKASMIQVMDNRDGTVSLKTSKGKYLTAEKNGALNARAQGKGKAKRNQKFLVIFNKGRTVSFMSVYNKYIVAEKNGRMKANRAWNRAWEKFRVVRLSRKRVLLQVPNAEVPTVEVPTVEVPNAELPNAELPNAELPNAELSNAELPNVELLNAKPPNAEGKP